MQWKKLCRLFPAWSLAPDLLFNASSYSLWGSNLMASAWRDWRVRRAATVLAECDNVEVLSKVAQINAERAEATFKAVAISYVTLPLAIAALVSDAAPEIARTFFAENLRYIVPLLIAAVMAPFGYFCGLWRAKQINWCVELFKAGALAPPKS